MGLRAQNAKFMRRVALSECYQSLEPVAYYSWLFQLEAPILTNPKP